MSTSKPLQTFAFQSSNKKTIQIMNRALAQLVKHQPEDWEIHLAAAFRTMELAIKCRDFSKWVEFVQLYGAKLTIQHLELLEKGEVEDDCDCQDCVNRRSFATFKKESDGQKVSETFSRYYGHLCRECAFKEQPVTPWKEALESWQAFDLQTKMDSSERSYWTYAAAEDDVDPSKQVTI